MKTIRYLFCLTFLVGIAQPLTGQIFVPPQCEVDTKHYLVKEARIYVKAASESREPEAQNQALQGAFRVLHQAINEGETENSSVWYFLGRAYALVPDFQGADSAFTKVEQMHPDCADDTDTHRYQLYIPAYNAAVGALQIDDLEAARPALENANTIYHKEPNTPYYLASVYGQLGERELAIEGFREFLAMGADTGAYAASYQSAVFNMARLFHQGEEWDSAIVWYRQYRAMNPDDKSAVTGLAASLEASGRSEEAAAIFNEMLGNADSLTADELFSTGISLFNQNSYAQAANAFEMGLNKNPYHRDAIFNLVQSYYAIASPDEVEGAPEVTAEEIGRRTEAAVNMLEASKRLADIDFQNEDSQRLMARAYQLIGDEDSTIAVIMRMDSALFNVSVFAFHPVQGGFNVQGEISNRKDHAITVPPITFTFVDNTGATISTETFASVQLQPEQAASFQFQPTSQQVAGWKYEFDRALGKAQGGS